MAARLSSTALTNTCAMASSVSWIARVTAKQSPNAWRCTMPKRSRTNSPPSACAPAVKRNPEEWRVHPQGQALAGVLPIELAKLADGPQVPFEPAAFRPLERLRVLDFTHLVGRTDDRQAACRT